MKKGIFIHLFWEILKIQAHVLFHNSIHYAIHCPEEEKKCNAQFLSIRAAATSIPAEKQLKTVLTPSIAQKAPV